MEVWYEASESILDLDTCEYNTRFVGNAGRDEDTIGACERK